MLVQRILRGRLLCGTSRNNYMMVRNDYINEQMAYFNRNGLRLLRIEDEPTSRGPLGNVYGHVNFVVEADTDDPAFQRWISEANNSNSSEGGCYIATCVYGSYDCPQVWTLRRYRDLVLAQTLLGRAFVRIYYAISPKIVKNFGSTLWFKNLWKKILDRIVCKLKGEGIADTPYTDK